MVSEINIPLGFSTAPTNPPELPRPLMLTLTKPRFKIVTLPVVEAKNPLLPPLLINKFLIMWLLPLKLPVKELGMFQPVPVV